MNSIIVRAMAQSPLPTMNATMPTRYVRRRPQRSEPGPQIGIDTAAASMYAANVHAYRCALPSSGNATGMTVLTIVLSRPARMIVNNTPSKTRTPLCLDESAFEVAI